VGVEIQLFEVGSYISDTLAKRMRMVFQRDGAPAHYSCLVTYHLNLTFPERWIGRSGQVQWPPMSPDFRLLSVGIDEKRSLPSLNTRDELVACIMNSAALIKQERQLIYSE
jgi:hypothetical protein